MRHTKAVAVLSLLMPTTLYAKGAADRDNFADHVLLVSIDGLHALDVARFVESHPHSALATLADHGVTYTNARLPAHSDSFPGLLALVTGGSPVSHGVFYDVSYDRKLFDPTNASCTGQPGNTVVFDESIDLYDSSNVSRDMIDPSKLPRRLNEHGQCVPVYPHEFVKTNTIFEIVRAAGGQTAWADKHPAYDLVNGPSGKGVADLYTPEITNVGGADATVSVVCTAKNDLKKVAAILNQIHGRNHDGTASPGIPTVFGMNFQAVSVGQKLAKDNFDGSCAEDSDPHLNGQPGGYKDASGTPTDVLTYGLEKTDQALQSMIDALESQGIYDSTLFIVSAKHGQSPINPLKVNKPGHFADLVAGLPDAASNPAAQAIASAAACSTGRCGFVMDDDVALIWLADQSQATAVASYLNANAKSLFIDEVMAGKDLLLKFNNPLKDDRTPDLIVQPSYGTIYTTSKKKLAEHGGFSFGDTNVGLIVSRPHMRGRTLKTPVLTSQVAPTILRVLGLDPDALKSVQVERTPVLPGF
jgi:predicted AlkP superfamily pyrophosphatase or phosphodiesterase